MSSTWGERLRISVFGESHGSALGVVMDGLPAGEKVDMAALRLQMARRAPGQDATATPRKEADEPRILSGLLGEVTTGAPLCVVIENNNTQSGDYANLMDIPRPGHADYTAWLRYAGHNDLRGGGHFSGRLTAAICAAGGICRQILARRGVCVGAHVLSVGEIQDDFLEPVKLSPELLEELAGQYFPTLSTAAQAAMRGTIEAARLAGDSVGGVVECGVTGLPAGLGDPMFGGVEPLLASILFGIPAVKGVEFGAGFALSKMRGSEANDPFFYENGIVKTATNHMGGVLGGITDGMPLVFRCAFKPTPSIAREQQSVDLARGENAALVVQGRHDPCILPRAVPVIEAAAALALMEIMSLSNS